MKNWQSNLAEILVELVNTSGSLKRYAVERLEMDEFDKEDCHAFVNFQFAVWEHLDVCVTCYEWKRKEELAEGYEESNCTSCTEQHEKDTLCPICETTLDVDNIAVVFDRDGEMVHFPNCFAKRQDGRPESPCHACTEFQNRETLDVASCASCMYNEWKRRWGKC